MDTPTEANARFATFMTEVKDSRCVWVLRNEEGYARWSGDDGVCFPVWARREMAERAAAASFPDYRTEEIALDIFRRSLLPSLRDTEIWIDVNLTEDMCDIEIPCDEFEREISSRVA